MEFRKLGPGGVFEIRDMIGMYRRPEPRNKIGCIACLQLLRVVFVIIAFTLRNQSQITEFRDSFKLA